MQHDRNDQNNTKFIVFLFCSLCLNFCYVTQYFLRILRNNVFLSLMRKFCKIFLNLEPRKTVHLRPNQLDLSNLRFSRKINIHISVKYDGTFFFFVKYLGCASSVKTHIFWEGRKFLRNLHHRFVLWSSGQIYGGYFANFFVLLRIYEL